MSQNPAFPDPEFDTAHPDNLDLVRYDIALTGTFNMSDLDEGELADIFGHGLSVPEMWSAIKSADEDQLQQLVELAGERGSDPLITMTSANAHLFE